MRLDTRGHAVADADAMGLHVRDHFWRRLDCLLLVRHILAIVAKDHPLPVGKYPDIDAIIPEHLKAPRHRVLRNGVLLDHREIAVDQRTAVERSDRQLQIERNEQHPHAERRPAAGDGERDATRAQRAHCIGCRGRDLLVLSNECAVDV